MSVPSLAQLKTILSGVITRLTSTAYSTSSAYTVGSYCLYNHKLYRCTTAIGSGGEAWNAGHWTQVKIGDELKSHTESVNELTSQIANLCLADYDATDQSIVFRSSEVASYDATDLSIAINI